MNDNDAPLSTFTSPDRDRYFEDYVAGAVYILGEVHIDRDEMVAYSRKYDPQDMHINEEKAVQWVDCQRLLYGQLDDAVSGAQLFVQRFQPRFARY